MNQTRTTMLYGSRQKPTLYLVVEESNPEWCVELGAVLEAMDTADLREALVRGVVTPSTRVWREGLEGWTPIKYLTDLIAGPRPCSLDRQVASH